MTMPMRRRSCRRATSRGHSPRAATTTSFDSRAERGRSGGSKRWPSGSGRWPTRRFLIQKVGAKGQPPQDLASGDDLPDAGAGPRFNTQTVDAAVRWQVPEDGLYQILISDLYSSQRGHPRLTYRLVIRREQPDFSVVLLAE